MKQSYEITTPAGEMVRTIPGNRGQYDMKILSTFPRKDWPQTLYYVAVILRLKGMVEERNYPNGDGPGKLMTFVHDAIFNRKLSIKQICEKHKIPLKEI